MIQGKYGSPYTCSAETLVELVRHVAKPRLGLLVSQWGEPLWIRAWKQHDGLKIEAGTVDLRLRVENLNIIPTAALFPTTWAVFRHHNGIGTVGITAEPSGGGTALSGRN